MFLPIAFHSLPYKVLFTCSATLHTIYPLVHEVPSTTVFHPFFLTCMCILSPCMESPFPCFFLNSRFFLILKDSAEILPTQKDIPLPLYEKFFPVSIIFSYNSIYFLCITSYLVINYLCFYIFIVCLLPQEALSL